MRKLFALFLLLTLGGCISLDKPESRGGKIHELGDEYLPLEKVRERSEPFDFLVQSPGITTTIGTSAYVKSIDLFLEKYPIGSPGYVALMRHEQEHAKRQLDRGLYQWIAQYGVDRQFALIEEQIGYYYQMRTLMDAGVRILPEVFASRLSNYKNLSGSLISYEDALEWARDVVAGRWLPPAD